MSQGGGLLRWAAALRVVALAAGVVLLLAAGARARPLESVASGSPFACPDPSAVNYAGATFMACTTDGQPNAFSLWASTDKQRLRWLHIGYVFPRGHKPAWALSGGHWWAPDLERVGDQWRMYFSAQAPAYGAAMVIGVAWSKSLAGPWSSKILHWRGQFNSTSAQQEIHGGVIDPGEALDPATGRRYLVWSEQTAQLWIAPLSSDGLSILGTQTYQTVSALEDPADCSADGCCVEGSALMFHAGHAYLLYSVRSTWDSTYAMRAAVAMASNPLVTFQTFPGYILQSGPSWYGPGGGQKPVEVGGRWLEFYHAMSSPMNASHTSDLRLAMSGPFTWSGIVPAIGDGRA